MTAPVTTAPFIQPITLVNPDGTAYTLSSGTTINATTITGGTAGRVLYDNAGTVGEFTGLGITAGALASVTASSLTATGVVYAGTSGLLTTDETNFAFDATNKRLQVGSGSGATSGLILSGGVISGYGLLHWTGSAPTSSNYILAAGSAFTYLRGPDGVVTTLAGVEKLGVYTAAGRGIAVIAGTAISAMNAFTLTGEINYNTTAIDWVKWTLTDTLTHASTNAFRIIGGSGAATDLFVVSKAGNVAFPGSLGVRALSTLTDGADGTNTNNYKFVSFVSNSAEAGNVIRVAQTSAVVFTTSSSRELKNLKGDSNLDAATDRVMNYRMREYEWKSQPGTLFNGPFAEEIYAVNKDPMLFPDGDKQINMSGFLPDLIMAVQALRTEVNQLKGI